MPIVATVKRSRCGTMASPSGLSEDGYNMAYLGTCWREAYTAWPQGYWRSEGLRDSSHARCRYLLWLPLSAAGAEQWRVPAVSVKIAVEVAYPGNSGLGHRRVEEATQI